MSRLVLLDTNSIIGAFETEEGNVAHAEAKIRVEAWLIDPEVRLAINPLIRFEVLRGAKRRTPEELDQLMNGLVEFEIKGDQGRRAAEIFRFSEAANQELKLNKRRFDVLNWACAELNGLEFDSNDGDIPKIKKLVELAKQNA